MSSNPAPEFSRPIALARLGATPLHEQIEASADERQRLARRFELISLDRLTATVTLRRREAETILLEAEFSAEFVQECVVTLEPVAGAVRQSFALVYGPSREEATELDLGLEDNVFEPLNGDSIDIGEAVAQELSLALPEFPRHPDAPDTESLDTAANETADTPFAALARLRHADRD